jgi:hypothetical protein
VEDKYDIIFDNNAPVGPGKGFCGDEILSKDELNLIFDFEDEQRCLG